MIRRPVDRLAVAAADARPDLDIRAVVVTERRPRWLTLIQLVTFLAVVTLVAGIGFAGSPIVVALTAAGAGWCATVVGGRLTHTELIALGDGRAHLFEAQHSLWRLHVGAYRGALRRDELVFVNGGRVHDEWRVLGRPVRALRVDRELLDRVALRT